ncbi:MAG: IPT/TIG domain-containing protein [Acidimicrobiales bacterium]
MTNLERRRWTVTAVAVLAMIAGLIGVSTPAGAPPPGMAITGVSPAYGPGTGGTAITITGTGLSLVSTASLGSLPMTSVTVVSDTKITAVTPAITPGTAGGATDLTVTDATGGSATLTGGFTYSRSALNDYLCLDSSGASYSYPTITAAAAIPAPTSLTIPSVYSTGLVIAPNLTFGTGEQDVINTLSVTLVAGTQGDGSIVANDALTPFSQTVSATGLPVTATVSSPIVATIPALSWQAGPTPGTGEIEVQSMVVGMTRFPATEGGPVTTTLTCQSTGTSTAADLAIISTHSGSASPTLEITGPVAPLQGKVTPGSDAAWSVTVANTSTSPVTGVSLQATVDAEGSPITFNTAGMQAAGTTCIASGANQASCTLGTVKAGTTATVTLQVQTSGLAAGTAISGSVTATSTSGAAASALLAAVSVVTIAAGVITIADPGVPVASSPTPPSATTPSVVRLKLPRARIAKTHALVKLAGSNKTTPPPVAITLQSLPASSVPTLCQAGCLGAVVLVSGSFGAYSSRSHPISVVVQIYYGTSVPTGAVAMLKDNGVAVSLPACTKLAGVYNTPCVNGAERTLGASGARYTQDTVYFAGGDPFFSRR